MLCHTRPDEYTSLALLLTGLGELQEMTIGIAEEGSDLIAPVHRLSEELAFTIDEAVRGAHKQVCADLPKFNGTESWELPMAGTFLIDQVGTVRPAFFHPYFTRRLDPSVVIARLNELKGEREGSTA